MDLYQTIISGQMFATVRTVFIVVFTAICLVFMPHDLFAQKKGRKQPPPPPEYHFINLDSSIGIGFYEVPSGASRGGTNFRTEIVPVSMGNFGFGLSTGRMGLVYSELDDDIYKKETYPVCLSVTYYFHAKGWNSIPYIHLTPGLFILSDTLNKKQDMSYGFGGSSGVGIYLPIEKNLYIDLAMRFYYLYSMEKDRYMLLTSCMGFGFRY